MPIPTVIAIDGPVASGKTTVGRLVAKRLGYRFLDTGLMYRAVTDWALEASIDLDDAEALAAIAVARAADAGGIALAGGSEALARAEVGAGVSLVSRVSGVRRALVAEQRRLAAEGATVMVGRDIGTVVLPEAAKVYLDAPAEVRVERRREELAAEGRVADVRTVREELELRDRLDSERGDSPLRVAAEAVVVDTGGLGVDDVVDRVIEALSG